MFRGRYDHTVDGKGRLSIPSRFREILSDKYSESLVVTNFDRCLVAFPQEEWENLERKAAALSQLKKEVKAFQRYFISGATECPLDAQGRILLPPKLREYADLQRDVVVVGMLKKIEIWSKTRWEEAFTDSQKSFEEISDVLADLGL
ncbi:MAG TPA: division/cell wall cluster transcriptional repressor MraZ [Bdellovibrionota bacterium]|nr:division/cell wall cluster transcriptional repressor MraZ [Bdellovibrionota bacterium]